MLEPTNHNYLNNNNPNYTAPVEKKKIDIVN